MLVPPNADWAEGPPASVTASAAAAQRPEPLPPELEARLRRQRAQQYGRAVRESLAAAHARQAAKREAAAAAQREAREAQRAARLARLAERQQVQRQQPGSPPACGTAAAPLQHPSAGNYGAHARAAGAENTSPATLLRAVEQLDAKLRSAPAASPHSTHGGSRAPPQERQQRLGAAQQPALRQRQPAPGVGAGGQAAVSSASDPAGPAGTSSAAQPQVQHPVAAAAPVVPPVDPLEQLLQELLAAEGAGDPYSIINLYVAEQLQLQQAPAPALAPARAAALPAGSQPAHALQGEAATTAAASASRSTAAPQPLADAMPQEVPVPTAAAAMPPALGAGAEEAPVKEPPTLKEQPSLKLQPSESAPSTARHRRSSSLMLPQQFDVAAVAEPVEWSIAALGMSAADLPMPNLCMGPAAGLAPEALPPQPPAIQRQQSAAGIVPLEQPSGSKQLYVQEWLQRSAAELAAAESAPAGSSVAYSEDPDHASAELQALSSLPSPATAMAAPPAPSSAAAQGGVPAAFPDGAATASAGASPEAAAAAAPSGVSGASRSASAVTSTRRPGAPEPPSSSSQLDGSSSAPSHNRAAAGSAAAAAQALPAAVALAPPREEPQLQAPAHYPSLSSSSWDGGSGAGSEVQAPLSFSQLQAVAVADGAAGSLPSGGEHPTTAAGVAAEEGSKSSCSPASPSSDVPSSVAAPRAAQPAPYPADSRAAVAAPPAPAAAPLVTAAAPDDRQSSAPSSETYSSDFDSDFEDAEISYGDLGAGSGAAGLPAAAASADLSEAAEQLPSATTAAMVAAPADSSRPSSPRLLQPALWQAGGGSPPGSAGSQQRPRSPHHAALDDRYPGSPPGSGGLTALQLPVPGATYSRPHSPASQGGSPRASGDGGITSRPISPGSAVLAADAEVGQPELQQEDTVVVHSPAGSSSSSGSSSAGQAGSPYSIVQFGTELASVGAAEDGAAAAAAAEAVVGSPPGTPVVASPGEDYGSCPGSARVDDDTVVQTEEHNRAYLQEVLDYFLRERAEAFAAGAAPYPLELDGYLAIERRRPACGDPQHIWNKLLFDAANEALAAHYAQAVCSLTGRLAPRVALLDPALLDRHVTQRVLRWATLGGSSGTAGASSQPAVGAGGGADLSALLAEDAAEEERTLGQLVGALHAELAAAASRAASPEPAGEVAPASPAGTVDV